MGYYTDYILEWTSDEVSSVIEEEFRYDDLEPNGKKIYIMERKWYEHEQEIAAFSTRFPEEIFILTGFGEDNEDIWRKYFKNGKIQRESAIITFGDFDELKLRKPEIF